MRGVSAGDMFEMARPRRTTPVPKCIYPRCKNDAVYPDMEFCGAHMCRRCFNDVVFSQAVNLCWTCLRDITATKS